MANGRQSSGGSRKSGGARSGSSKSGSSRSSGSRTGGSSKARASSRPRSSATTRRTAAARGRQQKARSTARKTAKRATKPAEKAGVEAKTVAEFREMLRKNLIRPLDLVMLTRERIEEALNDAAERGRITADDAQELASSLVQRGRKQTNDVLSDLEGLLGRGRDEIDSRSRRVRKQVEGATGKARTRAVRGADPVLAQADRARRRAGVGPSFPITAYDDLTAAQVQTRLTDLTAAELRKVRDYERRNANRKSVLSAVERKLA